MAAPQNGVELTTFDEEQGFNWDQKDGGIGSGNQAQDDPEEELTGWDAFSKKIRKQVVETVEFEMIVTSAIIINCIFLAMDNPDKDGDFQEFIRGPVEIIFTIIYTLEMILKWIAWGFFGQYQAPKQESHDDDFDSADPFAFKSDTEKRKKKIEDASCYYKFISFICCHTDQEKARYLMDDEEAFNAGLSKDGSYWGYFRDGWNIFDFIIIVLGSYVPLFSNSGSVGSLRAFRVLRPLRTFKALPKLRVLVATIVGSLGGLFDVCILIMFLFLIFAIIGTQSFKGDFRMHCVDPDISNSTAAIFNPNVSFCKEVGNPNACKQEGYECLRLENPNNGLTSFDNVAISMLQVFQVVTLDGWSELMYAGIDTKTGYVWIYYICITFLISFFSINLILAVIVEVYRNETNYYFKRSDEENVLDEAVQKINAYSMLQREVNDEDAAVGQDEEGLGRRMRELVKKFRDVIYCDRKLVEVDPYVMVSFHLRFHDTNISEWNPVKAWKYKVILCNAVNKVVQHTDERILPIDIEFGPNTSCYLCVRIRVSRVKDIEQIYSVLKNQPDQIIEEFNSQLTLTMESMETEDSNESAEAVFGSESAEVQRGFVCRMTFSADFGLKFLDERTAAYDSRAGDAIKEALSKVLKGTVDFNALRGTLEVPGMAKDVLNQDDAKTELRLLVPGGLKRDVTKDHKEQFLDDYFGVDTDAHHISAIILTGQEFSDDALGSARSGEDLASPFAAGVRKARMQQTDNVEAIHEQAHAEDDSPFDKVNEGGKLFRKQVKQTKKREKNEIESKIADFNRVAAHTVTALSKDRKNHWLDDKAPWKMYLNGVCHSDWFDLVIFIAIVANTIVLACVWDGQSNSSKDAVEVLNIVFQFIFMIEAAIKLLGLGWRFYFGDNWNNFDFSLVILGLLDMCAAGQVDTGALLAFRAMRLLRVFRLLGRIPSLRILLSSILEAVAHVSNLLFIFFLMLFVFAVLGVQLFSGKLAPEYAGVVPWSFDNFWKSLVTTFQVFTGDDWSSVMWVYADSTDNTSMVYFVVTVTCGIFLLMNVFIAILLSRMEEQDDYKTVVEDWIETAKYRREGLIAELKDTKPTEDPQSEANKKIVDNLVQQFLQLKIKDYRKQKQEARIRSYHEEQRRKRIKRHITGVSCNIWEPEDQLRFKLHRLVHSWQFEWLIIIAIVVNCIFLAMDNPHISDSKKDGLRIVDYIFTGIFTVELVLRVIADGFYEGENSYLKDWWNCVDGFVVLAALISLPFPDVNVLKAVRAIRPIRVGIRIKQVRRVISALLAAVPSLFQVIIFCFFFWFVIAVFGVHLFKGRFARCVCAVGLTGSGCVSSNLEPNLELWGKEECHAEGHHWANHDFNFDNVFEAIFTTYKIGTMSGWWREMFIAISMADHTGESYEAYKWNKEVAGAFFIFAVIVAGFFSLNLFISVVVDSFHRVKVQSDSGSAMLTQRQAIWVRKQRLLSRVGLEIVPSRPLNNPMRLAYDLVEEKWFEPFIVCCIIINAGLMCIDHWGADDGLVNTLEYVNIVFVAIFLLEAVLKIWAYGWKGYSSDWWNVFDCVIVIASLLGIIIQASQITSIFRVLRIGRVIRLVHKYPVLRALFMTLVFSSPSLLNIGSLIFVIFFIFSILGIALFGNVVQSGVPMVPMQNAVPLTPYGIGFNNRVNFDNFGNAMLTIYRMGSGDGWETVYSASKIEGWECDMVRNSASLMNLDRDCGSAAWSVFFYTCLGIGGTLVFTNLFIAVILDVYRDNMDLEENLKNLQPVLDWRKHWMTTEKAWRKKEKLGKVRGFMPVGNFLKSLTMCPELVGLMLDACKLRLPLDEDLVDCAGEQEFYEFHVNGFDELRALYETDFCGELNGVPSPKDRERKVTRDHIGAIIESHKLHLLCRFQNPRTPEEELVVYYDDAVFAICYLITGPEFPVYKFDPEVENPIVRWWENKFGQTEMDDDQEAGSEDYMDALMEAMAEEQN